MTLYRRPSQHSDDPEERRMWVLMSTYTKPSNYMFDPEFRAKLDILCPPTRNPAKNKELILDWVRTYGEIPHKGSACSPEEKRLNNLLRRYTSPSSDTFDPGFRSDLQLLLASIQAP